MKKSTCPCSAGVAWLAVNFSVRTNVGGTGNKLYYLYGLEHAGRLAGAALLRPP